MELQDHDLNNEEMDLERFLNHKRATALAEVANLKEAFERFDLNHDDKIDRREQVIMYRTIESEIEDQLRSMTGAGRYEEARALQRRLAALKREFEGLQTLDTDQTHSHQRRLLRTAEQKARGALRRKHAEEDGRVSQYCADKEARLDHLHQVQRTQLEMELANLPVPRPKLSKRCLELLDSEANLSRLKQYEEAKAVRRMIDKIKPKEEKRFYKEFEGKKEARRRALLARQAEERRRLGERLGETAFFHDFRKGREESRHRQMLTNLSRDMGHAHALEKQRRPELSLKPSALWQTRRNHRATSAALRGQHFLDNVKGKKTGEKIYVASLTGIHDFQEKPLSGTTTYF